MRCGKHFLAVELRGLVQNAWVVWWHWNRIAVIMVPGSVLLEIKHTCRTRVKSGWLAVCAMSLTV